MTRRRPLVAGGIASCLALAGSLALGTVPAPAAPNLTQVTFQPTGASTTWSVPTGVRSVLVSMAGGSGGSVENSGFQYASTLTGTLTIPTGATSLEVNVGGAGSPPGFDGAAGWNGGGSAGSGAASTQAGGGGGGATDLRLPGATASQALMVAGGSGGSGGYGGGTGDFGGVGGVGGLTPGSGARSAGGSLLDAGGRGGAGGSVSGAVGGNGGSASGSNNGSGGGGGGGWASGAGGQAGGAFPDLGISIGGGGGGGGQSYADPAYVAGVAQSSPAAAHVTLSYLTVSVGTIPSPLNVGNYATWQYSAGSDVTYAIASGTLPPGLVLDSASGLVRGVPTAAGTYTFAVAASAYPDGTNPITTEVSTTVQIGPGGTGSLVANSATNVGTTTATGNASAYAGGSTIQSLVCDYWLGASATGNPAGFATATPSTAQPNATGAPTPVTCQFTGLTGNTTYSFQLVGLTASGTLRSNTVSFRTGSTLPQPTTQPPSSVGTTSATGAGALSATQNVTAIACRVATTIAGVATGTSFTASPASTTGVVGNRPLTCSMTGLTANTVYYYAFFATDAAGTAASPTIERFETRASPPFLSEISASSVTATTATITGSVTPTNEAVTSIACRVSPASGGILNGTFVAADPFQLPTSHTARTATCALSGLTPSTAYRVRMEAVDRDGTGGSPVIAFTTAASGGGGGGGGGEPPAPAPTPSTPSAPAVAPAPAPAPAPTTGVRLRPLIPGLSRVLDPAPGTVSRVRVGADDRVTLRVGRPTSVVVRGLPPSRWVVAEVRPARGGPGRALPRAKASGTGVAVLAPVEATRRGASTLRITPKSGPEIVVRLSAR